MAQSRITVPPLPLDLLSKNSSYSCPPQELTAGSDRSCATGITTSSARYHHSDPLHCLEVLAADASAKATPNPFTFGSAPHPHTFLDRYAKLNKQHPLRPNSDHMHSEPSTPHDPHTAIVAPSPLRRSCIHQCNSSTCSTPRQNIMDVTGLASLSLASPIQSKTPRSTTTLHHATNPYRTPVGTPRVSPHSPRSPSMLSPLRMVGVRSPCSVRLTGSTRITGPSMMDLQQHSASHRGEAGTKTSGRDDVLMLDGHDATAPRSEGLHTPAIALPMPAVTPSVQRALPFSCTFDDPGIPHRPANHNQQISDGEHDDDLARFRVPMDHHHHHPLQHMVGLRAYASHIPVKEEGGAAMHRCEPSFSDLLHHTAAAVADEVVERAVQASSSRRYQDNEDECCVPDGINHNDSHGEDAVIACSDVRNTPRKRARKLISPQRAAFGEGHVVDPGSGGDHCRSGSEGTNMTDTHHLRGSRVKNPKP